MEISANELAEIFARLATAEARVESLGTLEIKHGMLFDTVQREEELNRTRNMNYLKTHNEHDGRLKLINEELAEVQQKANRSIERLEDLEERMKMAEGVIAASLANTARLEQRFTSLEKTAKECDLKIANTIVSMLGQIEALEKLSVDFSNSLGDKNKRLKDLESTVFEHGKRIQARINVAERQIVKITALEKENNARKIEVQMGENVTGSWYTDLRDRVEGLEKKTDGHISLVEHLTESNEKTFSSLEEQQDRNNRSLLDQKNVIDNHSQDLITFRASLGRVGGQIHELEKKSKIPVITGLINPDPECCKVCYAKDYLEYIPGIGEQERECIKVVCANAQCLNDHGKYQKLVEACKGFIRLTPTTTMKDIDRALEELGVKS